MTNEVEKARTELAKQLRNASFSLKVSPIASAIEALIDAKIKEALETRQPHDVDEFYKN